MPMGGALVNPGKGVVGRVRRLRRSYGASGREGDTKIASVVVRLWVPAPGAPAAPAGWAFAPPPANGPAKPKIIAAATGSQIGRETFMGTSPGGTPPAVPQ
jgi:hypothetical protein